MKILRTPLSQNTSGRLLLFLVRATENVEKQNRLFWWQKSWWKKAIEVFLFLVIPWPFLNQTPFSAKIISWKILNYKHNLESTWLAASRNRRGQSTIKLFLEKEDENLHSVVNFRWFSKDLLFLGKIQIITEF